MNRRLIYLSYAAGKVTEEDLEHILHVSRRNNERDDITGLLLYHEGTFLQCLEGPPEKVLRTLTRISIDKRHRGVRILTDQREEERLFPAWEMGFEGTLTGEKAAGFVELREKLDAPTASQSVNDLIAIYFTGLKKVAA